MNEIYKKCKKKHGENELKITEIKKEKGSNYFVILIEKLISENDYETR